MRRRRRWPPPPPSAVPLPRLRGRKTEKERRAVRVCLTVVVKDDERALLTRDGKCVGVLGAGRHRLFDPRRRLSAEVFKIVRGEIAFDRYATIASVDAEAARENFVAVQTLAGEVAVVSFDGQPTHFMTPWQSRAFWKGVTKVDV